MRNADPDSHSETPAQQYRRLYNRAIHLLARRDHTRQEILEKFRRVRKKAASEIMDKVLVELETRGYLKPPQVIAAQLIETYKKQRKGRRWIENKLRTKGITIDQKQAHELGLDDTKAELRSAQDFILRKFKSLGPFKDHRQRARVMRALTSRGFSNDVVFKVIKSEGLYDPQETADEGF